MTIRKFDNAIESLKPSKTFYTLYGLFDGLDVSVGSLKYLCKALSLAKEDENHALQSFLTGELQILTLGFFSMTTGLAMISHYYSKNSPNDTNPMLQKIWLNARYLLKSAQCAVKTYLCLLPLIKALTQEINFPYSIYSPLLFSLCVIGRSYHTHWMDKLNQDIRHNHHLLEKIHASTHHSVPLSAATISTLLTSLKTVDTRQRFTMLCSSALAGIIDKPQMFYAVMTLSLSSTPMVLITSSLFALFLVASVSCTLFASQKKLHDLQKSQLECNAFLMTMPSGSSCFNPQFDAQPWHTTEETISAKKGSLFFENTFITHFFFRLEASITFLNYLPMAQILSGLQMLRWLPMTWNCAFALLLVSGALVGAYLTIQRIMPSSHGAHKGMFAVFEFFRDDLRASMAMLCAVFINYYKGIRLSNFALTHIVQSNHPLLKPGILLACMSILSLEKIVKIFSRQKKSEQKACVASNPTLDNTIFSPLARNPSHSPLFFNKKRSCPLEQTNHSDILPSSPIRMAR